MQLDFVYWYWLGFLLLFKKPRLCILRVACWSLLPRLCWLYGTRWTRLLFATVWKSLWNAATIFHLMFSRICQRLHLALSFLPNYKTNNFINRTILKLNLRTCFTLASVKHTALSHTNRTGVQTSYQPHELFYLPAVFSHSTISAIVWRLALPPYGFKTLVVRIFKAMLWLA